MIFIETSLFTQLLTNYLSEDEYLGLSIFLLEYPDFGKVVRDTGGVRKLHWAVSGKDKSDCLLDIYYWQVSENEICMLAVYEKGGNESIPADILKKIAEEIKNV